MNGELFLAIAALILFVRRVLLKCSNSMSSFMALMTQETTVNISSKQISLMNERIFCQKKEKKKKRNTHTHTHTHTHTQRNQNTTFWRPVFIACDIYPPCELLKVKSSV